MRGARRAQRPGFNEAVGYYRRNPGGEPITPSTTMVFGFNEAVGYYRRNRRELAAHRNQRLQGFNEAVGYYRRNHLAPRFRVTLATCASMRPSDITDGIGDWTWTELHRTVTASMRPSDITDGITVPERQADAAVPAASMRPSDITDGIAPFGTVTALPELSCFNEAVGYYRRNRRQLRRRARRRSRPSFNEAVGYYRRNPSGRSGGYPCTTPALLQ